MTIKESLSYDDVLLMPAHSRILPGDASVKTRLAGDLTLNIPVLSAAMDTVSEDRLAIALALEGGAGVIHRNLTSEDQAKHVGRVKRYLNWIIESPLTVHKDQTISAVRALIAKHNISGLPVVDNSDKLCGIVTGRDLRFCRDNNLKVEDIMTLNPVTERGVPTPESAREKFDEFKIEKLPVVDAENHLTGLVTAKDMEMHQQFPLAATDASGRLIVGAAISPQDYVKRLPALIDAKVDFVVFDTAHGDTKSVIEALEDVKKKFSVLVVGGNVATAEGTRRLIDAGADAVKVGVGPGSICTTRVVAGIGVPQLSAVMWCAEEADKHGIPVIADGGIKFSGDITKAMAGGACTVMLGNLLAGLKEAPGREIIYDGRMFKQYRGMGSMGALKEGSGDRYRMGKDEDPVPEGIEGRVPFKGELRPFIHQLVVGLKKGMGYCGCESIEDLRWYKNFVKITNAGLTESHPHDVVITQEAPNYSRASLEY
ncbi:MAG: IMP dehydrogenase [Spirochaetales bacterium]|jgi:IMP dehydrogenase|nr:IMP dehydrogenase [Spirochaetales bacterium]